MVLRPGPPAFKLGELLHGAALSRTYLSRAPGGARVDGRVLMSETNNAVVTSTASENAVDAGLMTSSAMSRDYAGKLVMVMNGALVGVPAAYAVSHSLMVTAMAAGLAGVSALVLLAAQRAPRPRRRTRR